jgi:hypothetical protein
MEKRAEHTTQAPLAISEQRETYIRQDGTTFTRSDIFVKLSVTFRDQMLAELKGPPLSVYLCIALHCGGVEMTAYPSIKTICKETGYSHTAVIAATRKLEKMGLVSVTKQEAKAGDYDQNFYHVRGYATMGEGSKPSLVRVVNDVDYGSKPSLPKEESIEEQEGADAPHAPDDEFVDINDDPFWDEHDKDTNPAQKQVERMRSRMGSDPFSVAAHCQEAQEREGQWTMPAHYGLSSACAAYRRVFEFSPKKYQRKTIDETVNPDEQSVRFWEEICQDIAGLGWSPTNVQRMLKFYVLGALPSSTLQEGRENGGSSGPREQLVSVQPAEPTWLGEPT